MIQLSIFWSADAQLYETLTGGPELLGKIFIKINCMEEFHRIIYFYKMKQIECSLGKLYKNNNCIGLLTECTRDNIPNIVEQFKSIIGEYNE